MQLGEIIIRAHLLAKCPTDWIEKLNLVEVAKIRSDCE